MQYTEHQSWGKTGDLREKSIQGVGSSFTKARLRLVSAHGEQRLTDVLRNAEMASETSYLGRGFFLGHSKFCIPFGN